MQVRVESSNTSSVVADSSFLTSVGRPLKDSARVYGDGEWVQQALLETKSAKRIVLFSYMYDHDAFHKVLLRSCKTSSVVVVVDKEQLVKNACRGEKTKLKALHAASARVLTMSGRSTEAKYGKKGHPGSLHVKCLLLDNKIAWFGSANFTNAQDFNYEMMSRLTGKPVDDIVGILEKHLRSGRASLFTP